MAAAASAGAAAPGAAHTCAEPLLTIRDHTGDVYAVALSPDGDFVASGGASGVVLLHSTAAGALVHECTGHSNWVRFLDFSLAGNCVASASDDASVRVWSMEVSVVRIGQALVLVGNAARMDRKPRRCMASLALCFLLGVT